MTLENYNAGTHHHVANFMATLSNLLAYVHGVGASSSLTSVLASGDLTVTNHTASAFEEHEVSPDA